MIKLNCFIENRAKLTQTGQLLQGVTSLSAQKMQKSLQKC